MAICDGLESFPGLEIGVGMRRRRAQKRGFSALARRIDADRAGNAGRIIQEKYLAAFPATI